MVVAAQYLRIRVANSCQPHAHQRPPRPQLGRRLLDQTQLSFFNLKCQQRMRPSFAYVALPSFAIIARGTPMARLLQRE
jgi:hypothetical protein